MATAESAAEGAECTGGACFAAGTPVRMADGSTKAVERVRRGDRVQARDPATGQIVVRRVVRTFVRSVDHTLVLTLPSGEQVETTEAHPFFVDGRGWVQAGQLGIGTQILTRAGPGLGIADIERRWQAARVYNFEVEGAHCYFVGSSGGGLCVHNAPCPEGGPSQDVRALRDLANEASLKGNRVLSVEDAEALLEMGEDIGEESGVRAKEGDVSAPSNWRNNPRRPPHIHIPEAGRGGHIEVEPGVRPRVYPWNTGAR